MSSDDLAADRLAPNLRTQWLGRDYVFLPSCGSTNDEVSQRSAMGANEGLVVATDQQSKGRGRRGRTWHSPPGQNLYFSILLRPALAPHQVAPMTLLAGAALAEALAGFAFTPRLKWPNDVLLETSTGLRKVAGILAEMATEGGRVRHVVLGVGINVSADSFPADLAEQATSLALVRGRTTNPSRLQVLTAFLHAFEPRYRDFVAAGPASTLEAWRRFAILGQACWVEAGTQRLEGIAEAVDESGGLLMRTSDGQLVTVHAGEINWRKAQ